MHEGHRERLRNRAEKNGLEGFEQHEILELMLFPFIPRKNTNELAHLLIETFGSIAGVFDAEQAELEKIKGMPSLAASSFSLMPEVFSRYELSKIGENPKLDTVKACEEYFKSFMRHEQREEVYMVCLDNRHHLIKKILLGSGVVNRSTIFMRDVMQYALMYNAASVVIAHNHPSSGKAKPSMSDEHLTKTLIMILGAIKIPLLDHLIIGTDSVYSFRRDGKLEAFRKNCLVIISDGEISDVNY